MTTNETGSVAGAGRTSVQRRRGRPSGVPRPSTRAVVQLLVGGVSIYLLLPTLLRQLGQWRSLSHLAWPFVVLAVVCEVAAYVCIWALDRIVLRTREWFPVVTAQLSGNALGRVVPGGGVTATAFASSRLRRAGVVSTEDAAAAYGTASLLQVATTLALPILALPAIVGGAPVDHSLVTAATLGVVLFALLVAAGAVALSTDEPLLAVGRATQWLLNKTVRRNAPISGFAEALLAARDSIRSTLGSRWQAAVAAAAGSTVLDYLALLAALRAVGADPRPSLVLLAYTAAAVLALVPFTPGGLGFVEAGLAGMLTLAGVPGHDAVAATLVYRLVSYWLPLPAGAVAYALFCRRYPETEPA